MIINYGNGNNELVEEAAGKGQRGFGSRAAAPARCWAPTGCSSAGSLPGSAGAGWGFSDVGRLSRAGRGAQLAGGGKIKKSEGFQQGEPLR